MSCFSELKMICENQAEAERAMPLGDSETAGGAFWLVPPPEQPEARITNP